MVSQDPALSGQALPQSPEDYLEAPRSPQSVATEVRALAPVLEEWPNMEVQEAAGKQSAAPQRPGLEAVLSMPEVLEDAVEARLLEPPSSLERPVVNVELTPQVVEELEEPPREHQVQMALEQRAMQRELAVVVVVVIPVPVLEAMEAMEAPQAAAAAVAVEQLQAMLAPVAPEQ